MVAALHEGIIVATVYGMTVRKNKAAIWEASMKGMILNLG
jgi:hypothetical protein